MCDMRLLLKTTYSKVMNMGIMSPLKDILYEQRHKNMYFAYAKTKAQISERAATQRIVWDPIFRGSVFWRLR